MARKGLLSVITNLEGLPRAGAPGVGQSSAATGGAEAALAAGRTFGKISDELASMGSEIGAWADKAAAKEGAQAGALAGLDAEFRPRGDGTVYSEAYDKAALDTYGAKVRIEIENDIEAGGDLTAKKEAWLARVPIDLKPDVELKFQAGQLAAARKAAREAAQQAEAEAKATLLAETDGQVRAIHQRAYQLGLDASADGVLAGDIGLLRKSLQRKGPDGKPLADPVQIEKIVLQATEQVADARIMGAFERTPDLEAKKRLLDGLDEDFKASRGLAKVYDLNGFQRIRGMLSADLNRAESERRIASNVVTKQIEELKGFAEKGYIPKPEQIAGLRAVVAASPDPEVARSVDMLQDLTTFMITAGPALPEQNEAYAASIRKIIDEKGPSGFLVERADLAEKLAENARSELKSDALGWANRVGRVKVEPLDFSTPEAAKASMGKRIAVRDEVAGIFGVDAPYLQPDEVRRIATSISRGGDAGLSDLAKLVTGAGDRAPAVLEAISKEAPVSAMLGGHVAAIGMSAVARDASAGLAVKKVDGFKSLGPKPQEMRDAAADVLGSAMLGSPGDETALMQLANAAYEIKAQALGLTTFDAEEWKNGVRALIGERKIGMVTYGGVVPARDGYFNDDRQIILPPNVRQDRWRDVIGMITRKDLAEAGIPVPVDSNGREVPMDRVIAGTLVPDQGIGRYQVAAGDPDTPGGEMWIYGGKPGAPLVLDLNKLTPILRKRRPDLFLGSP